MSYRAKTGCGLVVYAVMAVIAFAFKSIGLLIVLVAAMLWLLAWVGRKTDVDVRSKTCIDGK